MILSAETIAVLKNFMTINQSIILYPGNEIISLSATKATHARAKVEDEFPSEAPIWDLGKFLGILSLTKEPADIEFGDTAMIIRQGKSRTKYAYCRPDLVVSMPPDKTHKLTKSKAQFKLENEVWQQVKSAMGVMGFEEFAFIGEEGVLSVQALSTKNESSDTFNIEIGETDLTFKAIFESDKMKLIPGDYDVTIFERAAVFKGDQVEYTISLSTKSEI